MALPDRKIITLELTAKAITQVRRWEAGERDDLMCPMCGAKGLQIVDKSARPHMAWFDLTCAACGLHEAVAVPESAHATDHD